ncbi:hypothetical protein [Nitrosovibrio sp. Nv6]|uniref:hypothetical protein n=1 Tax=Nitrosovibrio sp. Nv6 TaxID=1855340 RepID=UPI0008C3F5D0|nr:hypothetical protein [Nitrosovibrio sp. Nv6]SEO84943.1 hypothetical protein SAMN05216316_1261 [Nitrosovibrio sp. Nv6]
MAGPLAPFLIAAAVASALASAGGTIASMSAQSSIRKKQAAARNAEAVRQRDIDRRRDIEMQKALPEHDVQSQEEKQQGIADELYKYMTPTVDTSTEYMADNMNAPQIIKDTMQRQLVGALQKGKNYARNLSQVSSLGRLNLDNKLGMNRLGERVGMLNNESARSSGILPMELDDANLAGLGAENAAGILNGVGGIADAIGQYQILDKGGIKNALGLGAKPTAKGSPLPLNSHVG